jgi:hypothetical protein
MAVDHGIPSDVLAHLEEHELEVRRKEGSRTVRILFILNLFI